MKKEKKKKKKKKAQGTEQFQKALVWLTPYIQAYSYIHTQGESSQKTDAKI